MVFMSQKKLKFALFGNVYQERKSAAVQKLLAILVEREAEILIPERFLTFLRDGLQIQVPPCEIIKGNQFDADFVFCMGGDGTFLDVPTFMLAISMWMHIPFCNFSVTK